MSFRSRFVLMLGAVAAGCVWFSSIAAADFGFKPGSIAVEALDANGNIEARAGAHPYEFSVAYDLNTVEDPDATYPGIYPDGELRGVEVDLPEGMIGNATAVPMCTMIELSVKTCAPTTQVGYVEITTIDKGVPLTQAQGVYNVVPNEGNVAQFGFTVAGVPTSIQVSLADDGTYRVRSKIKNVPQALLVVGAKLTLWGVPADPRHDVFRGTRISVLRVGVE